VLGRSCRPDEFPVFFGFERSHQQKEHSLWKRGRGRKVSRRTPGVSPSITRPEVGCLIVSSQGNDTFLVCDRQPSHAYVKTFSLEGVEETDGVDVTNVNLGPDFPYGLFVCHANGKPSIAVVTAYEDLGLEINASFDPRTGMYNTSE